MPMWSVLGSLACPSVVQACESRTENKLLPFFSFLIHGRFSLFCSSFQSNFGEHVSEKEGQETSLGIIWGYFEESLYYSLRHYVPYHGWARWGGGLLNTWSLAGLVLSGRVAMLNYNIEDDQYMAPGTSQKFCVCTLWYLLFETVIKADFVSTAEGSESIFPYDVIKEKNIATTKVFSHLLLTFFDRSSTYQMNYHWLSCPIFVT